MAFWGKHEASDLSTSQKTSSKIAIPSRTYGQNADEAKETRAGLEQLQIKNSGPAIEKISPPDDSWAGVSEKPDFPCTNLLDKSRIKIPDNPYMAKDPQDAPKLAPHSASYKGKKFIAPQAAQKKNPEPFNALQNEVKEEIAQKSKAINNFPVSQKKNQDSFNMIQKSMKEDAALEGQNFSSIQVTQKKAMEPVIAAQIEVKEEPWPSAPINVEETISIATYKTTKCQVGENCKGCPKYHYLGERRRDLSSANYSFIKCARGSKCLNSEKCGKAHNFFEVYYHPQVYLSLPCPYIGKNKICPLGNYCNFLHSMDKKGSQGNTVMCKGCNNNEVGMVRVVCGHACCRGCALGPECKRCNVKTEAIKLEL